MTESEGNKMHNEEYFIQRYYELKAKEEKESNRLTKALYRDEMRKIKNILLATYSFLVLLQISEQAPCMVVLALMDTFLFLAIAN